MNIRKRRPGAGGHNRSTPEKFWSRVSTPNGIDGCWEWTGHKIPSGYGRLGYGGKLILAHRLAWELTFGPIPQRDGKDLVCVLHKCDNPPCCNPNHLFLGTRKDNVDDMRSKGRENYLNGAEHASSKLTEEQIRKVREIGRSKSTREIGDMFGVSKSCIKHILSGRTHKRYLEVT